MSTRYTSEESTAVNALPEILIYSFDFQVIMTRWPLYAIVSFVVGMAVLIPLIWLKQRALFGYPVDVRVVLVVVLLLVAFVVHLVSRRVR